MQGFNPTHNVGRFATCLQDVDGVVGVHVLHGNPIDHDNLIFGAEKKRYEMVCVGGTINHQ